MKSLPDDDSPRSGSIAWTEEEMVKLWKRRREAEQQQIRWPQFVDMYYPNVSITGVRHKFYEARDMFQPRTGRRSGERLSDLDPASSCDSSEISLSDHESDTHGSPQQAPTATVSGKRTRSASDAETGQLKKAARISQNNTEQDSVAANALVAHNSPFSTASQLAPLSDHERDEASIRLARLTPQNWLYILEQAQACDTAKDKFEQLQRELKNTAGRLAETEAELQFMRNKMKSQAGDSSDAGHNSQYQASLQGVKTVASELRSAFTGFETRSKDCMASLNWDNEDTQKHVKAVKEKFDHLDKAIQALPGRP